jgi:calcineurin-like phosphoesterase family protein
MKPIKITADSKGRFPNVWITSDTHFGHKNICRGVTDWRLPDGTIPVDQTRDFSSVDEMNDIIVRNINDVVGQNDILIHLGDWSFGGFENIRKFWDRLVCKNIHLTLGNHDHHINNNKDGVKGLFKSVDQYTELIMGSNKFVIMHYPISSWDGLNKGVGHLHGHCHLPTDKRFGKGKRMDVGIDGHPEFRPYNLMTEVVPMLEKQPISSEMGFDHHTDDIKGIVG